MKTATNAASTFLSDNETKVDLLNNESIAITIIGLLLNLSDRPVTIGIHGDWGAGKSSVLEMIEESLSKEKNVLCIKFNSWRFQGFEDAKIALLEGIVNGLLEKKPALKKATDKIKGIFRRIDWLKVAKHAGSLAFTAFTGIPDLAQLQTALSNLDSLFRNPTSKPTKQSIDAAFENAYALIKPETDSKKIPQEINEFRKAFDELLEEAKINRLVILIDDLDRCLPEIAIETLEALRLFVFTPRTAFVVAADEAMIEYAVSKHFPGLPNTTGPQSYARNYLEKLIQVPIRIPALGITETRIYITLLLIGAELGENNPDFEKLIVAARERLKRPWANETIDAALIKEVLKEQATKVSHALNLSDQIGPILASGTSGNPRQIKRFLNALMLRKQTADARGFGNDIVLPVLAKLMLAERYMESFFHQVALKVVESPNGICQELKQIEAEIKNQDDESLPKVEDEAGKSLANEWLSSRWISQWKSIQPPLGDIDLRPYLFVTKDRKDYFGETTIIGRLAIIAEQLFEPKIIIQRKENQLKQLNPLEATQVFEIVRSQIMGVGKFDTPPNGIDGIAVLVKAQPSLQSNLLDFFESLPTEQLGAWAVAGWANVIIDGQQLGRFERQLTKWSEVTNNPILKVAATGALQMPKRGR